MRYLLFMFVITVLIVADFAKEMDEQEIEGLSDSAINNQFESTYVKSMDGTDERASFMQYRVKRARGCGCGRGGKQHTKNARPSTQQKHEKGQTRMGGEKGDARRPYRK
ncbi:unnamed protein product [Adineta steineri]|uniref:Uncharacterized protein n=1 Tax=Adineta steineri TaxID=433720 RepID=A0A813TV70_9BILA|nr:unnamed protein product [Adineta steineri]CAF4256806.1 unnamed protein product [Adineta steineri]